MQLIKINIKSVYDGDTFRADVVGAGRFKEILTNAAFRLKGVNCPEKRGGSDLEKRLMQKGVDRLLQLVDSAKLLQIDLDGKLSFGRFHTDLYIDSRSWADIMIEEKLAVPYNGSYSVKNYNWDKFIKENHKDLI